MLKIRRKEREKKCLLLPIKEFVKSTAHPPYSKTAKLLIKNTYTVKSYLMEFVGDA